MKNITELNINTLKELPEKILQFGEGNFLRAFADDFIDELNQSNVFNGSIVIAKPTNRGNLDKFNNQNCLYTVAKRGMLNGKIVERYNIISSVSRCLSCYSDYDKLCEFVESPELKVIISNTTEAGIVYVPGEALSDAPNFSFPAKLTTFLHRRYKALGFGSGPLILPVELIENNGEVLKSCVLKYALDWDLEADFISYINDDCKFCSTLVDRIVTGFPTDDYENISYQLGYNDNLLVSCEPYNSWIIEGSKEWKNIFPIHSTSANVLWTDNILPYRTRKVRILNGTHTMSVLAAYLCGINIVRDMMSSTLFLKYIKKGLFDEIIPTIDLPENELRDFAGSVLERFNNPFIDHRLLDISLNSVSKFRARCLDTIYDYEKIFKSSPDILSFSLAALIAFYNGKYDENGNFFGVRNEEKYYIMDSKEVTDFFENAYKSDDVVKAVLKNKSLWDADLTEITGFYNKVKSAFNDINQIGMVCAVEKVVSNE